MNRKNVILAVTLIISCMTCYILGSVVTQKIMLSSLLAQSARLDAIVNLGRYIEYRNIAIFIKENRNEDALCSANLGASAMYDELVLCLASQDCREVVKLKIHDVAPEILGEAPLKFTYIKSKDGFMTCK